MTYTLSEVVHAVIGEFKQRHVLSRRLFEVRRDPHLLEDIGFTYPEIKTALEDDQRANSSLRRLFRRKRGTSSRRAAVKESQAARR